jgi:hypothetical protein
MRAVVILLWTASVAACSHGRLADPRPYTGWLPAGIHVDLRGTLTLSPAGDLLLELEEPCLVNGTSIHGVNGVATSNGLPCDRAILDALHVVATTPWHSHIPGVWTDGRHIVFHVDWQGADIDQNPLDLTTVLEQPWVISEGSWIPTATETRRMFELAEGDTHPEGAAPVLQATVDVEDGALLAGGVSTLTVHVANLGGGPAYRVSGTILSGVKGLQNQRLVFGRIGPDAEKLRRIRVTVPPSETSPDALVAIEFSEANGFPAPEVRRRVSIVAARPASALQVQCGIDGHAEPWPQLDAGEAIKLRCQLDNSGSASATVDLEISIAGEVAVQFPEDVAAGGHTSFTVPITVPPELVLGAVVEIEIVASARGIAHSTCMAIVRGEIREQKLCVPGHLTGPEYRDKVDRMRAAVQAGTLTPAQFDAYDVELIRCLQRRNDALRLRSCPTIP